MSTTGAPNKEGKEKEKKTANLTILLRCSLQHGGRQGRRSVSLVAAQCTGDLGLTNCSTGVDGVDLVIGTSSFLREFSHGKSMAYIQQTAIEVIEYLKG